MAEEIKISGLTFQEAKNLVDISIRDVKDGFVATGYYLWIIREERLWEDDGYNSFQEFLHCQYQKDKSWASRCIGLYEQFGKQIKFGELPVLADPYRNYSVSQLIEMVSMTEAQREQVTPEMKVREIREMKPKREKKAGMQTEDRDAGREDAGGNAGGEPEPGMAEAGIGLEEVATSQLEEEPDSSEGTGRCAYRERFSCTLTREQQRTVGEKGRCHASCCWECPSREGCRLECNSSASRGKEAVSLPEPEPDPAQEESSDLDGIPMPIEIKDYDHNSLMQMISNAEYEMKIMGDYWKRDMPGEYTKKCMEIQAYKSLLAEHDGAGATEPGLVENPDPEQPELPDLKNDDQRKEWLKNYKAWGLWYRDEHIDVNYYKFDFDNGSRLVVAEYPQRETIWDSNPYDDVLYHLIEKNKQKHGCITTYDDKFQYHATSDIGLIKYLKKIQRKK